MSVWTSRRVAAVLGTEAGADRRFSGVSTDTRALEPGALFVALSGERFDGHAFLDAARAAGAAGAVIRRGSVVPEGLVGFPVDDTLEALGTLARERRREVAGPVVAVTGTNGKTSTKELLARTLATRWSVHATRANLNNLVGVPLTILSAPDGTDALVVEAGASLPGEIARLRDVIRPTLGVITNIATGHLEGFGSVEGALREKVSLVHDVALAVVGTEPPELGRRARECAQRVVVAGTDEAAAVRPDAWSLDETGRVELRFRGVEIRLPLVGRHQADNAMLALAAACELELELAAVAEALQQVALPAGRCQVVLNGDLILLQDAYNANPASLTASLETAERMRGDRPLVVVLGSMLELGGESGALHRAMADRVMAAEPSLVAVLGSFVPAFERHAAALGDRLLTAPDSATLGELVAARLTGRELVLLKGSRGVAMERAIPHLLPDRDDPCSTIS